MPGMPGLKFSVNKIFRLTTTHDDDDDDETVPELGMLELLARGGWFFPNSTGVGTKAATMLCSLGATQESLVSQDKDGCINNEHAYNR